MKSIILAAITCAFATNLSPPNSLAQQPGLKPFTPASDMSGPWAFQPDPKLPNVLILGDSISIAYTRYVRDLIRTSANVHRPMRPDGKRPVNCGETRMGLKNIDAWLGGKHWDVIHFNWGGWDLCYRHPESKNQGKRDKINGTISVPLDEYKANLEKLVTRLKATGAKLIWAATTAIPEGEVGRFVGDEVKYNQAAAEVMKRHGVEINDLHAVTKNFAGKYSRAPGDVHYTPEGSKELAKVVAEAIIRALPANEESLDTRSLLSSETPGS